MATRQQTPTLQSRGDYAPANGAYGGASRDAAYEANRDVSRSTNNGGSVPGSPLTRNNTGQDRGQDRTRVKPVIPVMHEIAWASLPLQLLFVMILIFAAAGIGFARPILTGTLTYLIVGFLARLVFTRHHRQGMYLAQEGLFDEAVVEFQKSYEFFSANQWVDWWRFGLMLSSSRTSYREMALLNIAYCDMWNDRAEDGIRTYLRIVEEFPDNGMAWTAIKTFQQGGHDGERRARAALASTMSQGVPLGQRSTVQVSAE
jgi:hypothetical protein